MSEDETDTSQVESIQTEIIASSTEESCINDTEQIETYDVSRSELSIEDIPPYNGTPYVVINNNILVFSESDRNNTQAFEFYSDLDELGRCGQAYANICPEIQPTEERGAIGQVRPSGWHTVKYNGVVDGNYLYNRCHLIGSASRRKC